MARSPRPSPEIEPHRLLPHHAWYAISRLDALGNRPTKREFLGTPLVVFPSAEGEPAVLVDRCPHRNVPLSLGKLRKGDIECKYHGWRFGADGRCVAIPGSCERIPPLARAESHAVRVSDGWVWIWGEANAEARGEPFRFPHTDDAAYTTVQRELVMNAPLLDVAENALDVPHTAFLHRGLFRGTAERKRIEVEVRELGDRVEAEFMGERRPRGVLARALSPRAGELEHVDRFLYPTIAQVEYRLGERSHVVASVALTPLAHDRTLLCAQVSFRLPLPGSVVAPLVMPIAMRVLSQDAEILDAQRENTERFGERRFVSTSIDVLGPAIARLLSRNEAGSGEGAPARAPRRITMEIG